MNYDWTHWGEWPWEERFPEDAFGYEQWRTAFADGSIPDQTLQLPIDDALRLTVPRVFVSHRQVDYEAALRVAYLANQAGFEYWLDVLDPGLQLVQHSPTLDEADRSIAVASLIEMALMNSTHILALMTPCVRGSMWVPYEYGRVRENVTVTTNAACWIPEELDPFPDYLALGSCAFDDDEVLDWLEQERSSGRWNGSVDSWDGDEPEPLDSTLLADDCDPAESS